MHNAADGDLLEECRWIEWTAIKLLCRVVCVNPIPNVTIGIDINFYDLNQLNIDMRQTLEIVTFSSRPTIGKWDNLFIIAQEQSYHYMCYNL